MQAAGSLLRIYMTTYKFKRYEISLKFQIPLGMVSSNWGGTYVQAWSSPIALSKCNSSESVVSQTLEKGNAPNPNTPSVLWNAMIVPLLPMRVKGKRNH